MSSNSAGIFRLLRGEIWPGDKDHLDIGNRCGWSSLYLIELSLMNASQQSARRVASSNGLYSKMRWENKPDLRPALARDTVCISCRHRLAGHGSRRHASAAAAVAEEPSPTETKLPNPPVTAPGPKKAFQLKCSPVLSRPPVITRELTSFEKAFFLYQKRLNERLALPFTRYFYTKKETPADIEWKRKRPARRGTAARDIGAYNAYDDERWNDEVLIGSKLGEPEDIVEKLVRDAEGKDIIEGEAQGDAETDGKAVSGDARAGEGAQKPVSEVIVERPISRVTQADEANDVKSLNRKLDRSLYLLVQNKDGEWRFPEDRVYGRENLHQVRCVEAMHVRINADVTHRPLSAFSYKPVAST